MTLPEHLQHQGYAVVPNLLSAADCSQLVKCYDQPRRFRKKVVMQRHQFGQGEYQYFANPLPRKVASLRRQWYQRLAPIANDWSEKMGFACALSRASYRVHRALP